MCSCHLTQTENYYEYSEKTFDQTRNADFPLVYRQLGSSREAWAVLAAIHETCCGAQEPASGGGVVSPQSVAFEWQRSFPAVKHVPIVKTEGSIVYAQILTPCPLRDSNDMRACARMMSYDREIVRRANGYFAVTRSQAQSGVKICEVAISTNPISHLDVTIQQLDA
jgi:hypothetical protein